MVVYCLVKRSIGLSDNDTALIQEAVADAIKPLLAEYEQKLEAEKLEKQKKDAQKRLEIARRAALANKQKSKKEIDELKRKLVAAEATVKKLSASQANKTKSAIVRSSQKIANDVMDDLKTKAREEAKRKFVHGAKVVAKGTFSLLKAILT